PQSVLDNYEKKTGTHVNMTTYSSPDEMIAKVRAVSPGTYDLVVAPGNDVEILKKVGLLDKLDKSKIPNSKNYAKDWLGLSYDKKNSYSL
ncbi:extracellular solute-binding protein, partial [Flavobacterium sp. 3-210]